MLTSVVDASVWLECYLPGEKKDGAVRLIKSFVDEEKNITAPHILTLEFVNALYVTCRLTKKISREDATQILNDFLAFKIELYDISGLLDDILDISLKFNITSYDASYLALASHLEAEFFTLDQKLYRKVKGQFKQVKTF